MTEALVIHEDIPVVEQTDRFAVVPKLGSLTFTSEMTRNTEKVRSFNPERALLLDRSPDGRELFGVTMQLLRAPIVAYSHGNRSRQKEATVLITQLFMAANSTSQVPGKVERAMSLRSYFIEPRPNDTLLYALDAQRIEELAANTTLITSLDKMRTYSQDFLTYYCQELYVPEPTVS